MEDQNEDRTKITQIETYWSQLLNHITNRNKLSKDQIQVLYQNIANHYGITNAQFEILGESPYDLDLLFQKLIKYHSSFILKYIYNLGIIKANIENTDFSFQTYGYGFNYKFDDKLNVYLKKNFTSGDELSIQNKKMEASILNKNISKFIVKIDDPFNEKYMDNKLITPHFPLGSLNQIFTKDSKISLSLVDKILMILEIATALKDLHDKGNSHTNLSSNFIYVNAHKDCYLAGFAYNRDPEKEKTSTYGPQFYRDPAMDMNTTDLEKKQSYDVYSYGILIHEILFEQSPYDLLFVKNKLSPEQVRNIIINGDKYHRILLSEFQNDSSINEFKDLIQKCITNQKDRFEKFDNIIDKIKEMKLYKDNQNEIEMRFEKALSNTNSKCTLTDLIEGFYRGNTKLIALFENKFDIDFNGDLIDSFINCIKKYIDSLICPQCFDGIFNTIIYRNMSKYLIDRPKISEKANIYKKKLFSLSIKENNKIKSSEEEPTNFLYAVSTLESFVQYNKSKCESYTLLWIYMLAKEMDIIHSNNLFHGNLKNEPIGVYFNSETKTFVPSIILFYSYSKRLKLKIKTKKIVDLSLVKNQKRDLADFNALIEKLPLSSDLENLKICDEIKKQNSFKSILLYVYNFIINDKVVERRNIFIKNYIDFNYSKLRITYPELSQMAILIPDNFDGLLINVNEILSQINQFLKNTISNIDGTINENLPKFDEKKNENKTNIDETINNNTNADETTNENKTNINEKTNVDEMISNNNTNVDETTNVNKTNINEKTNVDETINNNNTNDDETMNENSVLGNLYDIKFNSFNLYNIMFGNEKDHSDESKFVEDANYLIYYISESAYIRKFSPKIISLNISVNDITNLKTLLNNYISSFDNNMHYILKLTIGPNQNQNITYNDIKNIAKLLKLELYENKENTYKFYYSKKNSL